MRRLKLLLVALVLWPGVLQAQVRAEDGLSLLDAGDVSGAIAIWTPLAERGDVLAQFNLGVLALQGQGGLTPSQAEPFFEAAAQSGHGPAQLSLADLAVDRQDWSRARDWYQRAASGGDPRAQFMAGRIADDGLAGPSDRSAAADWYEKAAEQDFPPAQLALGRMLVEQGNTAQGIVWLERAAQAGQVPAKFDLGLLLSMGEGLAKDLPAARAWYLRGAQDGDAMAMRNLSLMQARGQGGAQSYRTALAWAILAGDAGADLAEALRAVMSPQAQAQAEGLSLTCAHAQAEACD